jgi:hypothetical protein
MLSEIINLQKSVTVIFTLLKFRTRKKIGGMIIAAGPIIAVKKIIDACKITKVIKSKRFTPSAFDIVSSAFMV